MAIYEYRCRTCDERFEVSRPMTAPSVLTPCPQGHADTVKLLSAFASVGAAAGSTASSAMSSMPAMSSGGGCGSGCGCAH